MKTLWVDDHEGGPNPKIILVIGLVTSVVFGCALYFSRGLLEVFR